jgi:hypothetical protein
VKRKENTGIGKWVLFSNRIGTKMSITRISEAEFIMSGIDMSYMRTSLNEDRETIMFDPPGGPYTTAQSGSQPGTDLGYYDEEWKYFVVEKIEFQQMKPEALLTCIYTKPIDWETLEK